MRPLKLIALLAYWASLILALVCLLPGRAEGQTCSVKTSSETVKTMDHNKVVSITTHVILEARVKAFLISRREVDFGTTGHHRWKALWKVRKKSEEDCEGYLENQERKGVHPHLAGLKRP